MTAVAKGITFAGHAPTLQLGSAASERPILERMLNENETTADYTTALNPQCKRRLLSP